MDNSKEAANPFSNPWMEKIKLKDISGLAYEETAVLEDIKKIAAGLGCEAINILITEPQVMPNGMIIRTTGFYAVEGNERDDFLLDSSTLKRMAVDTPFRTMKLKEYHRIIAAQLSKEYQNDTQKSGKELVRSISEYESWSLCREKKKHVFQGFYTKTVQAAIEKYEG